MFKISYIKPLIAILLVRTAAHFPYPDFIVPAFPISDSWLEEFAIRLHDPVQFLVLCPSWHDCLLLWQSALFTKQQRQCWTRLSSIIISVTICCCQRKIQMDKRFSQGKWKSTVKARGKKCFYFFEIVWNKNQLFPFHFCCLCSGFNFTITTWWSLLAARVSFLIRCHIHTFLSADSTFL